MKQKTLNAFKILSLSLVLSTAIGYTFAAWTPAPGAPTGGNPNPPINTSGTAQAKLGNFGANNITATADLTALGNGRILANTVGGLCLGAGNCITSWLQAVDLNTACPANEFVTNIINGVATCDPVTAGGAVNQVTAGLGINVNPTTGNVVVTNTGVRAITAADASITIGGTATNPTIKANVTGGGVTGSGTSGRIPIWTSTGTGLMNSQIYTSTNGNNSSFQNVGINTSSPTAGFTIKSLSEVPEGGVFAVRNSSNNLLFRVGPAGGFSSGPNVLEGAPPATYHLTSDGSNSKVMQVDAGATNTFVIGNNGLVGINTSAPSANLDITKSTAASKTFQTRNPSGVVTMSIGSSGGIMSAPLAVAQNCVSHDASGNLINCLSDSRLKKNIETMSDSMDVLAALKQLRGVYFNWDTSIPAAKDMGERKNIGLIAQEVEKVFPEAVATDGEGYKSLDKSALVGFLIEVSKKQQAEIEDLQSRIKTLEQK